MKTIVFEKAENKKDIKKALFSLFQLLKIEEVQVKKTKKSEDKFCFVGKIFMICVFCFIHHTCSTTSLFVLLLMLFDGSSILRKASIGDE